jgi:hypothetical protein
MASYYELLKHPQWQKRRLEILDRAAFRCDNCGSVEKTLHVHHCFYEKGKKPWEYPDTALRCFCEDCHQKAEDRRLALGQMLSLTSIDDEVYGYALGAFAFEEQDELIDIPNYEIASGVADYWGVSTEDCLLPHLMSHGGSTCGRGLLQLVALHGAPTKPYLERYAKAKQDA